MEDFINQTKAKQANFFSRILIKLNRINLPDFSPTTSNELIRGLADKIKGNLPLLVDKKVIPFTLSNYGLHERNGFEIEYFHYSNRKIEGIELLAIDNLINGSIGYLPPNRIYNSQGTKWYPAAIRAFFRFSVEEDLESERNIIDLILKEHGFKDEPIKGY